MRIPNGEPTQYKKPRAPKRAKNPISSEAMSILVKTREEIALLQLKAFDLSGRRGCPVCLSDEVTASEGTGDRTAKLYEHHVCENCGSTWSVAYNYSHVENLRCRGKENP